MYVLCVSGTVNVQSFVFKFLCTVCDLLSQKGYKVVGRSTDKWRKHPYGSFDEFIVFDFFTLRGFYSIIF